VDEGGRVLRGVVVVAVVCGVSLNAVEEEDVGASLSLTVTVVDSDVVDGTTLSPTVVVDSNVVVGPSLSLNVVDDSNVDVSGSGVVCVSPCTAAVINNNKSNRISQCN
jgi:hypothetical protein